MNILIAVESVLLRTALKDYIAGVMPDATVTVMAGLNDPVYPADIAVMDRTFQSSPVRMAARKIMDAGSPDFSGRALLRLCRGRHHVVTPVSIFNATERQVLRHLIGGLSNKEIGTLTGLSLAGVKLHIRKLCQRTGARNRTQLALVARKMTAD